MLSFDLAITATVMPQTVRTPIEAAIVYSKSGRSLAGVLRSAVGALLVGAALMKAIYPADVAALWRSFDLPLALVVVVSQSELAFGCLLLSGWQPRLTRFGAIAMFAVFTTFSLYRALAGYECCGCFGPVKVNPWWTTLLDASIVTALIACPVGRTAPTRIASNPTRALVILGAFVAVSWISMFHILRTGGFELNAKGTLLEDGGLVILKPETWIGKDFALKDYLAPPIDALDGDWIVVLYHHDCPSCQEATPKYEALAGDLISRGATTRVLLIEVPPHGEAGFAERTSARHARLSDQQEWFIQTPVEILLSDSKVQSTSLDLPSVADAR
jgi:uncharacterized membrane protein YphA (DoxX/SURF4 family)